MNIRICRLIGGAVVFAVAMVLFEALKIDLLWLEIAMYVVAYLIIGYDVVLKALRVFRGKLFDENFLMTIATAGAFAIGEFPEAVAVVLFYQAGELFQDYAVGKSRENIAELMNIRPDYANLLQNGKPQRVSPSVVEVGNRILVAVGERIPLDGVVLSGVSMVDTSALTGESVPREVAEGEEVVSGCVNLSGVLTVEVTKTFGESTVSKILNLVENAAAKKSTSERFITKFARIYTPCVVVFAVLLAIIPSLIDGQWLTWLYRALTFLVVSCPCALVVSIPMTFFGGIGGCSRAGVLVKGGNYLEQLARIDTVVLDKTGTLTKGVFNVQKIVCVGEFANNSKELLLLASHAECHSRHPVSQSIVRAFEQEGGEIDTQIVSGATEVAGSGASAMVNGRAVLAGNARLMRLNNVEFTVATEVGTIVYVAVDGIYAGYILISDEIKPDSVVAIAKMKEENIKTVMLTGDLTATAREVGNKLGIDEVYAELLPQNKVERLEQLLAEGRRVAFVGDGINDAPVLARADVGVAMGGLGSDSAIEASDAVLMTDEPSRLLTARKIAKKTLAIAMQNIVFALGVKLAVLLLSAVGIANMWLAIFADVGVAVLCILNAFRALQAGKKV